MAGPFRRANPYSIVYMPANQHQQMIEQAALIKNSNNTNHIPLSSNGYNSSLNSYSGYNYGGYNGSNNGSNNVILKNEDTETTQLNSGGYQYVKNGDIEDFDENVEIKSGGNGKTYCFTPNPNCRAEGWAKMSHWIVFVFIIIFMIICVGVVWGESNFSTIQIVVTTFLATAALIYAIEVGCGISRWSGLTVKQIIAEQERERREAELKKMLKEKNYGQGRGPSGVQINTTTTTTSTLPVPSAPPKPVPSVTTTVEGQEEVTTLLTPDESAPAAGTYYNNEDQDEYEYVDA